MHGFWDVFWSDVTALATFAGPLVFLSIPAASVGSALGAIGQPIESRWRLMRAIIRGAIVGSAAALVLGMLVEYGLSLEGFSGSRRSVRSYTIAPLWGAAIAVALGAAFLAIRRKLPSLFGSAPIRRRFTLAQLFAVQLVVGLALGWWAFTRREEIGYRSGELAWRAQIAADKALFEPYGWDVETWKEYDHYRLRSGDDWLYLYPKYDPPRIFRPQPNVTDATLDLIANHPRVSSLLVISDGITDDGLRRLAANRRLWAVQIKSEQVTDAGAVSLGALPKLQYVRLESDHLTGAILPRLAEVKSLTNLTLNSVQITAADEAAFRAARPDVELKLNTSWPW